MEKEQVNEFYVGKNTDKLRKKGKRKEKGKNKEKKNK